MLKKLMDNLENVRFSAFEKAENFTASCDLDTETGRRENMAAWDAAYAEIKKAETPAKEYVEKHILSVLPHAGTAAEILKEIVGNPAAYCPLITVSPEIFEDDPQFAEEPLSAASFRPDGLAYKRLKKLDAVYIYRVKCRVGTVVMVGDSTDRSVAWAEDTGGGGYSKID